VLHFGDVHCSINALKKLVRKARELDYDVVAVHGDVECNGEILSLIEELGSTILFVPGNMDDVSISKLYREKGYNIDGCLREINGYLFCGIGGLSIRSSLNSIKHKLKKMKEEGKLQSNRLVILAHHPPRAEKVDLALGRIHAGLVELRDFILEYNPTVYLHGHIHEAPGYEIIGNTLVVNAGSLKDGSYALVDLESKRAVIRKLE